MANSLFATISGGRLVGVSTYPSKGCVRLTESEAELYVKGGCEALAGVDLTEFRKEG